MKKGKDTFYVKYTKRGLDILCSTAALTVFSPLFVGLTIAGAVEMKGNPFFTQERPGKDEKIFKLIKFRTMTDEKDAAGNLLSDEDRLNKYGAFLRSTSLDELPQAINILKGEMSVIGPRPLLVKYLPLYNEHQHHRHDMKPGLSGWAQVNGRNTASWEDKFGMDVWYTENANFLLDARIVIDTVFQFIRREGISSATSVTIEEFKGNA